MHDQVKRLSRREIPSVNKVLVALGRCDLPRPVIVDLIRRELSKVRAAEEIPAFEPLVALVRRSVVDLWASRLQRVICGTGIILISQFGRVPLSRDARRATEATG